VSVLFVNPLPMPDDQLATLRDKLVQVLGAEVVTGRADYKRWIPYERTWERWCVGAAGRYNQFVIFENAEFYVGRAAFKILQEARSRGKPVCGWDGELFYEIPRTSQPEGHQP